MNHTIDILEDVATDFDITELELRIKLIITRLKDQLVMKILLRNVK